MDNLDCTPEYIDAQDRPVYREISELLLKASDEQRNLIYGFVNRLLKD